MKLPVTHVKILICMWCISPSRPGGLRNFPLSSVVYLNDILRKNKYITPILTFYIPCIGVTDPLFQEWCYRPSIFRNGVIDPLFSGIVLQTLYFRNGVTDPLSSGMVLQTLYIQEWCYRPSIFRNGVTDPQFSGMVL